MEKAINSHSVEIINYYIGDSKILNLEVKNGWLVATLESGVKFRVKNDR